MSRRFWMMSAGVAAVAIVGGIGLGLFTTSLPQARLTDDVAFVQQAEAAPVLSTNSRWADANAPTDIHCAGCGPTLADRQRAADLAQSGYDGGQGYSYSDTDYAPARDDEEAYYASPAPPPSMQAMPLMVERFAEGGRTSPPTAQPTAPPVLADATLATPAAR
jgi:hypothetical protein